MAPIFTAQMHLVLARAILHATDTTATTPSIPTAYSKQYLFNHKHDYTNLNNFNNLSLRADTLVNTTMLSLTLFLLLLAVIETIVFVLLVIAILKRCILNAGTRNRARRGRIMEWNGRKRREEREWSEPWEDEGLLAMEPEERVEGVVMECGRGRRMV